MATGRIQRIIGSIALLAAGLLAALVVLVQFVIAGNMDAVAEVTTSLSVTGAVVSVVGGIASLLFVLSYVLLAFAGRQFGHPVGFLVLAVVFALTQLFFRFYTLIITANQADLLVPLNRGVNILLIVALLFVAVLVLVRGTLGGFARVALFLPALALVVIQFPFPLPYPGFLLPQAVYDLTWVVVAISYLVAKPRVTGVTVTSENLAE